MTARRQGVPPWFGSRITRAREARGWSVRQMAAKCGLAPATVLRAEDGRDTALSSAAAISSVLGLSLDGLLAGPECGVCDGMPPAGFICAECGRGQAGEAATERGREP